MKSVI